MNKRIEKVFKDRHSPLLTVTPERITMKFPNDHPAGYPPKNVVEGFFLKIAKFLEIETLSFRGVLYIPPSVLDQSPMERTILMTMYTNNRKFHRTFEIRELDESVKGVQNDKIKAEDEPKPENE